MRQLFEISGFDGTITPELIRGLLLNYFNSIKYPVGRIEVKEVIRKETS